MRTALGRAARAAGSCAHWLGNGGAGTRSSSIGRARARHRLWRWHHSSCTGRAGRAERLCSGRRHFGAIRSSGARTHRHRRVRRVVVISAGVVPSRMRYTCAGSAQENMPGVGGVIGGSRWRTASSDAFGHGFSRGAEHRERHPSPRLHRPAHICGGGDRILEKHHTQARERQIKAAGGKGMGSAGGAAWRCARGS
jgi:hypothetical protein